MDEAKFRWTVIPVSLVNRSDISVNALDRLDAAETVSSRANAEQGKASKRTRKYLTITKSTLPIYRRTHNEQTEDKKRYYAT